MDEAERRRFLDTLGNADAFRAAVRSELGMEDLLGLPAQVAHVTSGVNGLIDHQAELQQSVSGLVRGQERLGADVAELTRIAGQVLLVTSEGFASTNTHFDGIDARFTGIDARFTGISAHLDQIDAAIAELRDKDEPDSQL